jgi:hypothetical protein
MNYYEVTLKITTTGRKDEYTYVEGIVKGKKNYTQKLEKLIYQTFGGIEYITLDSWCFKTNRKEEVITLCDSSELYK